MGRKMVIKFKGYTWKSLVSLFFFFFFFKIKLLGITRSCWSMDLCNLKGMYRVNSSEMQVVTEPLKVLRPNEILKWTLKKWRASGRKPGCGKWLRHVSEALVRPMQSALQWFKQVVIKAWIRYSKTVKDKTYLILNKNDKKKPWMIKKTKTKQL